MRLLWTIRKLFSVVGLISNTIVTFICSTKWPQFYPYLASCFFSAELTLVTYVILAKPGGTDQDLT